jgi:hypothetical protein
MKRERPPRPEDLHPVPRWLPAAAREVDEQLRAFAARYPERFEYKGGKLQQKRRV